VNRGLAIAVLAVLAPHGASAEPAAPAGAAVERSVIDLSPSAGQSFTRLTIDNSLGDVRVEGHDGPDLVIIAVKRAPDPDTLERVKVSAIPDPHGPVSLRTRLIAGPESRPVPAGSIRVDLVIRAPRTSVVEARTWNGAVEVKDVDNGADLAANEGDIKVTKVLGAVSTSSAQGKHELADVIGEVSANSLYGDVKLDYIRGRRLSAVVHRGKLIATRIESREIDLRALRGDVRLELNPALVQRVDVRALRGDVRIDSRRGPFQVMAESKRGTVRMPASFRAARRADGRWVGTGPGAGVAASVSIRTAFGDVVFAVQDD